MPRGGQNRKPTHLKALHGTARADREAVNWLNLPPPDNLEPPRWLPRYAKQFWRRYATDLANMGLLTVLDVMMFEVLCVEYDHYRRLALHLETVDPSSDHYRPLRITSEKSAAALRSMATEFGLLPGPRSRLPATVSTASPDEFGEVFGDPMERLLMRGRPGRDGQGGSHDV